MTVTTADGRTLQGRVDEPKGDPGNTLSREELTDKALRLGAFCKEVPTGQMQNAVQKLWKVRDWTKVETLLSAV